MTVVVRVAPGPIRPIPRATRPTPPALPADELVEREPAARVRRETTALSSAFGRCLPIVTTQTKCTSAGIPSSALSRNALTGHAVDAGAEAFRQSCQLQQHEERAGIDVPVRCRPGDLLAVSELVLLAVALVVALLAHSDDHVHRARPRSTDPGPPRRTRPRRRAARARGASPASVTTRSLCPWLKPALGARRTTPRSADRLGSIGSGQVAAHHACGARAAPENGRGGLTPTRSWPAASTRGRARPGSRRAPR